MTHSDSVLRLLQRIVQYDKTTALNSVREINPQLASLAADKDAQLDEVMLSSRQ